MLKFGLTHSTWPPSIRRSDVFFYFELLNRTMVKNLTDLKQRCVIKTRQGKWNSCIGFKVIENDLTLQRDSNAAPPFRPIVSSIGTYNYNLSKFLCSLLDPHVPAHYNARDTFSFVQEINQLPTKGNFMVSFDVESLFTNIPLEDCIDLAIE